MALDYETQVSVPLYRVELEHLIENVSFWALRNEECAEAYPKQRPGFMAQAMDLQRRANKLKKFLE